MWRYPAPLCNCGCGCCWMQLASEARASARSSLWMVPAAALVEFGSSNPAEPGTHTDTVGEAEAVQWWHLPSSAMPRAVKG